jgi:hypothetical protein
MCFGTSGTCDSRTQAPILLPNGRRLLRTMKQSSWKHMPELEVTHGDRIEHLLT